MNKIRYLKLCILLIFTMLWHSYEIFAVNNNETIINANIKYKQNLDLNKYGGQDFADKHIKETSKNKQIELMKNRAEVKKRIDAVADLLKESKQYDMAYTFGGNHAENTANTISGIKNGMDCSSWMAYVFQMHGLSCNPKTNTAAGWHTKFKRLVEISKRTDRPIRMHTGVNETENGWIYTFSYGSDPAIKHIGISIGNQLCHARGAPDPKKWKTIDITNVIKRSGGATFSMADILEFCAYYPELAKQAGFELTNMMSPEQVRSEWSQVKKGHAGGQFPEGTVEENGDAGLSLAYNLFHLEFNFDEWHVDVAIAGSQKAFLIPPGLAFVAISDKAKKAMKTSDLPKYYFDLKQYIKYFEEKGETPYTPAIALILALNQSLKDLIKNGIENTINQKRDLRKYVEEKAQKLGFELLVKNEENRTNTLISVYREGVIIKDIINALEEKGFTVTGGKGKYAASLMRIGILGEITKEQVDDFFVIFEEELKKQIG